MLRHMPVRLCEEIHGLYRLGLAVSTDPVIGPVVASSPPSAATHLIAGERVPDAMGRRKA